MRKEGEPTAPTLLGFLWGNRRRFLPGLAFAIGRCAIEAMACGCAVIPVSSGMAGTLVTPENFSRWAASNFAPRWNNPADRVSAQWLSEELARYRPDSIAAVTQHLREEYDLDKAISALETIYHNAIRAVPAPDDLTADLADLALYLEGRLGRPAS